MKRRILSVFFVVTALQINVPLIATLFFIFLHFFLILVNCRYWLIQNIYLDSLFLIAYMRNRCN